MVEEQTELLTVQQIAERFGVTSRAVTKWIGLGYFPNAERISPGPRSPFRIPLSDVLQFERLRKVDRLN